jgi:uncharacterized protein YggT (Ycf19 family)
MNAVQQRHSSGMPAAAARAVPYVVGALEALLLARLVARLLAARPDNPFMQVLYALTGPLVAPLRLLDAQQPRFGSVLELSTLALMVLLPLAGYLLWRLLLRYGGVRYD